ncbi:MAG: HAD-IC family P-type ATPase [Clostridia bacterium]
MKEKLQNAHSLSIDDIVSIAETDIDKGLGKEEAEKRLNEYGPNEIDSGEKVSAWKILFRNLNNIIVYLLVIASAVAFIMNDTVEGFAVIVAILIAVVSGFISEYKAEKSIESLKNMVRHISKVMRDGKLKEVGSSQLVPGDLIFIEAGDFISADGRIVGSKNFSTVESALTGESEASEKTHEFTADVKTGLGDRKNMVFTGTAAARGNAYAIVTSTGMSTEIGKISDMIKSSEKTATPLEEQLDRLGKVLIIFAGIVAVLVTVLGILTGKDISEMIKIGIILVIAAVPEALPAVSTITLAIGMRTMARHNALVKSLPAVETLGSTTVICTDKTGTLTENQMTVRKLYLSEENLYDIEGEGYEPQGRFLRGGEQIDAFNRFCGNALPPGSWRATQPFPKKTGITPS